LRIIFAGTPHFAIPCLETLLQHHEVCAIYTKPDSPSGRGLRLNQSPIKEYAKQHCPTIPILQPITLKDPQVQSELQAFNADIMVVIAYGLILPASILSFFKYGCINVHASLLPRWRGAAPIQRSLLAGDVETGVTIMQIDEGLDTGAMLLQKSYTIQPKDTAQVLHDQLATLGASALNEVIDFLVAGSVQPIAQENNLATYAKKITKEESLIDWNDSAEQIARMIRAYNSWPIALTYLNGQILKIWEAEIAHDNHHHYTNGVVTAVDEQSMSVATGEGVLRLLKVQIAGGKSMLVKDFLNSRSLHIIPGKTKLG
jgi:methionyl-tRNA formyltransferase